MTPEELAATALPADTIGLLEGLSTTRAIRRYLDEPVPVDVLRAILFAATRAPTGSNRQQFRFVTLTDGPKAQAAKQLIASAAQHVWSLKQDNDGYATGSGALENSPKARMAATMQHYVDHFASAPVLILPCLIRYRPPSSAEGSSVYPACQNILLAARALGYGGVLTGFQGFVDKELRQLLGIPDDVFISSTITIGKPAGHHGPVRRRPIGELVFEDAWGDHAAWAVDPPGTQHTAAGPKNNRPNY